MMGYDDWLVRQWEDRCAAQDHYLDWCDTHNIDPDHPDAPDRYEEAQDLAAELAAERAGEARAEARAAGW